MLTKNDNNSAHFICIIPLGLERNLSTMKSINNTR